MNEYTLLLKYILVHVLAANAVMYRVGGYVKNRLLTNGMILYELQYKRVLQYATHNQSYKPHLTEGVDTHTRLWESACQSSTSIQKMTWGIKCFKIILRHRIQREAPITY